MKKLFKYFGAYFKSRRMAKLFWADSNPNYTKIKGDIPLEEKEVRYSNLRREIFEILYTGQDIKIRYKNWQCDFVTYTQNDFGVGVSEHSHRVLSATEFKDPKDVNDVGNLFPGITFESPWSWTPEMSTRPMAFNALGTLILSGKYNPKDQLVLQVVKLDNSSWEVPGKVHFKIIRPYDPSGKRFVPKNEGTSKPITPVLAGT